MAPLNQLSDNCFSNVLRSLVREIGSPQRYPRGTEFFGQGEDEAAVFILVTGLVKLLRSGPCGRTAIVGLSARGWILGGAAALLGDPCTVTARAVTPCEALCVRRDSFREMVRSNPQVSDYVHRLHAQEIGSGFAHLGEFGILTARQRLEARLTEIHAYLSAEDDGTIPLRDWELAQLVAVTPTYLCKLLHELTEAGRLSRAERGLLVSPARPAASPSESQAPERNGRRTHGSMPVTDRRTGQAS